MKKTLRLQFLKACMLLVLGLFFNDALGQVVIGKQGFETSGETWNYSSSGGGASTTNSGTPNNQRIRTGSRSYQISNTTGTITLDDISVSGYSDVSVIVRISSISTNATNGADAADYLRVFSKLNTNSFASNTETASDITVKGNSNSRWSYNTTGQTTTSGSNVVVSGTSGENTGVIYSTLIINIPNGTNTVGLKIISTNDATAEVWCIDDIEIIGTAAPLVVPVVSAASINGTVGVASTTQISATNSPTSYAISSGTLPAGLTLNTTSGIISGTPTAVGSYSADVTATNGAGTSTPATLSFTIAQGSQTISFAALGSKQYGDADFSLSATASSSLPVSYESSNPLVATVSGNILTIVGIGTSDITASQSGDTNYSAATPVVRTLTVTPKNLTITGLVAENKIYDATNVATATGTAALNGVLAGDSMNVTLSGTPIYEFSTASVGTAKPVNTTGYTISGSASSNYSLAQPQLTANINPKPITVSGAVANDKVYDATTNAVISGGVLSGVETSDNGNVVISSSGIFASANAGNNISVQVSLTGSATSNYSLTQPGITANITKADQTIVFNVLPQLNTNSSPINLNSYASVASGLALTYVSSNPLVVSVSGNILTVVGVGSSTITASQSGNNNYNPANDATQSITILSAPAVIAAWDFTGLSSPGTATAATTNSGISVSPILTRGSNASSSTGSNSFRTTGFQNNGISTANDDYFQTALTVGSGSTLSLATINAEFAGTASFSVSPGVSSQFAYSLDGTSFTLIGSPVLTIGSGSPNVATLPQIDLTGVTALQNIPAGTTVTFRYYASGQTTTGGWGFSSLSSGQNGLAFGGYVTTVPTSTTWENGAWSNGTPSASLDAIITQNYSTGAASPQGSFTAKSLTVNSGIFTVASGTSVTIENAIVNNAGSNNFIVENNANLIQTNAVANTGAIKVRRNSNPLYRYDYTLWSSPVIGQNLKAFSSGTLSNRFYLYNTATNTNGEYETVFPAQNEATYNFAPGSGYLIRTSDSHTVYVEGNPGTAINAEFTGVPYNQALNVTLSSANTGFNLVGNPYTSAISISQLFSQNSNAIDGTIWFWRKRNGTTGSGYATSTGMGVTSLHPEATAINTNGVIGTGQGFFVKVKTGATQNTLNFSNTLRSANTGGSFFRSAEVVANSQDVERHRIWLNLSNGTEVVGQTLLGYMTGATSGVDYGIEGEYFNDSPVAFTSYVENQEFAIQGRSLPFVAGDIVPMAFKTDVAGSYSIAIDHVDGLFAEDQNIYLKDNFTGQIHDIKSSSYSFSSESGIFNNRFEVVYQSQLSVDVPQISTNSIVVYKQNGNLVVNAGNYVMSKIELYDVSGRLVYTKNNIDASATVIGNLSIANQVLVMRITTEENGTANKKIVY